MRKLYIEAYYSEDSQILGNLDGQSVLHARAFERTKLVRALRRGRFENGRIVSRSARFWQVITEGGTVLARIPNPEYPA